MKDIRGDGEAVDRMFWSEELMVGGIRRRQEKVEQEVKQQSWVRSHAVLEGGKEVSPSLAQPCPGLLRGSGAREEITSVMAVDRDVEDLGEVEMYRS